ncbi:MAG: pyridoxal 5'-phosphate synthase lyase subunit PdxS, partial [Methanobacteriota archaeon]
EAVTHFDDPTVVAEVSKGLGVAMKGIEITQLEPDERMQERSS